MKKIMKSLKGKWNSRTVREQLFILWGLLLISFFLDGLNCKYLAMQYHCLEEDLALVTNFYWLSPVFGIVDLLLSILIFKKTILDLEFGKIHLYICPHFKTFEKDFEIVIPVIMRGANTLLAKVLSLYIMAVSICSLIIDLFKFFK